MHHFSLHWFLLAIFALHFFSGCGVNRQRSNLQNPQAESSILQTCIENAIALDDSLGKVRNHACETLPLAIAIQQYADGLQWIDYTTCPLKFSAAFEAHRQAWLQMIPYLQKYPEHRGEMHYLFGEFEKGPDSATFKPLLKNIWDTWAVIEEAMKD